MKAQPIEYEGVMHYPLAERRCDGCAHHADTGGCSAFTNFVKQNTGLNSSCTPYDKDVIWKVGDAARLQYITERLTT